MKMETLSVVSMQPNGHVMTDEQADQQVNEEIAARNCLIEREFASNTTCHGISYWCTSKYTLQKIFWVLLVLGMTSMMFWQVGTRISAYYEYESTTDITTVFSTSIEFPAVTICNFNRYFSPNSSEEEATMHALTQVASPQAVHFATSSGQDIDLSDLSYFDSLGTTVSQYLSEKGYGLTSRNELRMCKFGNRPCNESSFQAVITESGKCYTFNFDANETIYQYVSGAGYGLSLILDAKHWSYTEDPIWGSVEAGIKFEVHSKDVPPNVEKFGISVPVGRKAYATLSRKDLEVMYKPWGDCDPSTEKSLQYFGNYSLVACMLECYGTYIHTECDCRPFDYYWMTDVTECTPTQMANCSSPVLGRVEIELDPDTCGCTVPCNITNYPVQMSYSYMPNFKAKAHYENNFNDSTGYAVENILALDVSFNVIGYSKETQSKKVDESGLLSDIGGQLGLWIGMSVVTTAEIIQYLIMRAAGGATMLVRWYKRRNTLGATGSTNGRVRRTAFFKSN